MRTWLRLRLKGMDTWYWYRHTWWFQFAHSPLCQRYHQDVLRVGPCRLCRSCTLLYGAVLLTGLILLLVRPSAEFLLWVTPILGVGLLAMSYPPVYHYLHRLVRDGVRFATGVGLALLTASLFYLPWWGIVGVGLFLVGAHRLFRYQRMKIKQHACDGCPELNENQICSGYAEQADSIRVYRDVMDDEWNKPYVLPLVKK